MTLWPEDGTELVVCGNLGQKASRTSGWLVMVEYVDEADCSSVFSHSVMAALLWETVVEHTTVN